MEVFGIKPKKFFELVKDMGYFFIKTSGDEKFKTKTDTLQGFFKSEDFKKFGLSLANPTHTFILGIAFKLMGEGLQDANKNKGKKIIEALRGMEAVEKVSEVAVSSVAEAKELLRDMQKEVGSRGKLIAISSDGEVIDGSEDEGGEQDRGLTPKNWNGGLDPKIKN